MTDPFRVRFTEERHAVALRRELGQLAGFDLQRRNGTWEVSISGSLGDRDVVRVLNAVHSALADDPGATARVHLNGREYDLERE